MSCHRNWPYYYEIPKREMKVFFLKDCNLNMLKNIAFEIQVQDVNIHFIAQMIRH